MRDPHPPHHELIRLVSNPSLDRRRPDIFSLLGRSILDWGEFLRISRYHQLTPIIYYQLDKHSLLHTIPSDIEKELKTVYLNNLARNLLHDKRERHYIRLLEKEGIPCIPLKGTRLAERIYPHVGCRVVSDMDLLVPGDKVKEAVKTLERMDFRPENPRPLDLVLNNYYQYALILGSMPDDFTRIELHWNLCTRRFHFYSRFFFSIDPGEIWGSSIKRRDNGVTATELSAEFLVIHLLLHAFANSLSSFKDYVDLAFAINKLNNIADWNKVEEIICRAGMRRLTAMVMGVLNELFHVEDPLEYAYTETAPLLKRLRKRFNTYSIINPVSKKGNLRLIPLIFDRRRDRVHSYLRALFPTADDMRMYYETGTPELKTWILHVKNVFRSG